jgi:peptide/nickel transport system permease protein
MIKFIFKEIATSISSILIFLLIMFYGINILIPGDFLTPLRLMMSQAELDALRETLGANDPLYQRYFRWILGVFNGEITTGGFRQRSGKDIISTILPTLQVLIPSFTLAFYISRIPSIKTPLSKLHKNKIFSDTVATLFISLFPPIVLFLIDEKVENFYTFLSLTFDLEKTPISSLSISESELDIILLLFLFGVTLFIVQSLDVFLNNKVSKRGFVFSIMILFYVFVLQNDILISDIILNSKNAFKTIAILSIFFVGEYILINNVITQNIAREPHILTARALGYSKHKIYNKHILRNSFGPFATRLTLGLPYTIASLVIVESTTGWGGMGSVLYQSIMNQDSNAAMGLFLLLALLTAFLRITISVVQVIIDPRVRLK